jgi:hypothetical protein
MKLFLQESACLAAVSFAACMSVGMRALFDIFETRGAHDRHALPQWRAATISLRQAQPAEAL